MLYDEEFKKSLSPDYRVAITQIIRKYRGILTLYPESQHYQPLQETAAFLSAYIAREGIQWSVPDLTGNEILTASLSTSSYAN